jgi:hypothetical protein
VLMVRMTLVTSMTHYDKVLSQVSQITASLFTVMLVPQ